jgi:hypothetical protein
MTGMHISGLASGPASRQEQRGAPDQWLAQAHLGSSSPPSPPSQQHLFNQWHAAQQQQLFAAGVLGPAGGHQLVGPMGTMPFGMPSAGLFRHSPSRRSNSSSDSSDGISGGGATVVHGTRRLSGGGHRQPPVGGRAGPSRQPPAAVFSHPYAPHYHQPVPGTGIPSSTPVDHELGLGPKVQAAMDDAVRSNFNLNYNSTLVVINIDGTSKAPFVVPNLATKFQRAGGEITDICQAKGCYGPSTHGRGGSGRTAHVRKANSTDRQAYLVWVCSTHNHHQFDQPYALKDGVQLIPLYDVDPKSAALLDN